MYLKNILRSLSLKRWVHLLKTKTAQTYHMQNFFQNCDPAVYEILADFSKLLQLQQNNQKRRLYTKRSFIF